MLWIELPFTDGETTTTKLYNLDFYKFILPYGETENQCQLVQDDGTTLTIDLAFDIIKINAKAGMNWQAFDQGKGSHRLINLNFYKMITSIEDGSQCRLYQLNEETYIDVILTLDQLVTVSMAMSGGTDALGNEMK